MVKYCAQAHPIYNNVFCKKESHESETHHDSRLDIYWSAYVTDNHSFDAKVLSHIGNNVDWRPGQTCFNLLPSWATAHLTAHLDDPFYKVKTKEELAEWVKEHLVFSDEGQLMKVVFKGHENLRPI